MTTFWTGSMTKMRLEDGSTVELKGLHCPKVKGRRYVYHRKTGHRFESEYGTWALVREYEAFVAALKTPETRPGTLGGLIIAYRNSPEWADLAQRTRFDYETRVIGYLDPWKDLTLERVTPQLIFKLRDRLAAKGRRRTANYVLSFLSALWSWASPRGLVSGEPWRVPHLKRPKGAPRANRPWDPDERRAVLDHAPAHLKVPIALVMFTGLRESDALRLPWSVWQDGLFNFSPSKNEYDLWMKPAAELRQILKAAPMKAVSIAVNSFGQPWTASGFRASWRKLRIDLEERGLVRPGLTIHGLRHTVGNALADDGMNTADIARVLGHKTERQAAEYSNRAQRKQAAKAAVVTLGKMGGRTPRKRKL